VAYFSAVNAARAHFAKLNAVEALAMCASKEILLHCEKHKDTVDRESSSWL